MSRSLLIEDSEQSVADLRRAREMERAPKFQRGNRRFWVIGDHWRVPLKQFCSAHGVSYRAFYARIQQWPAGVHHERFWLVVAALKAARDGDKLAYRARHRARIASQLNRGVS